MKSLAFAIFLAVISLCAAAQDPDSLTFASTDWHWKDLGKGVQQGYAEIVLFGKPEAISVLRYPSRKMRTMLVHAPEAQAAGTEIVAQEAGAVAAINGSYFNMKRLTPHTFLTVNHAILGLSPGSESSRTNGLVCIKRKGGRKVEIRPYNSRKNDYYRSHYHSTIASGPILLLDGVELFSDMTNSFNSMSHPRTFFGYTDDGWNYMVVIDGRFPDRSVGTSIPETARIAAWFGLKDAINLDGGGSSTLWTSGDGVINHPCDNRTFDHAGTRKVPNILCIK